MLLQSSIWSMLEILRNLNSKEQFTLATSCKTLWEFIIQYIPIKHSTDLLNKKTCKLLKYARNLHFTTVIPKFLPIHNEVLGGLTEVTINFSNSGISDISDFKYLGNLTNITFLNIELRKSWGFSLKSLKSIGKLKKLTELRLNLRCDDDELKVFEFFRKLTDLSILYLDLSNNNHYHYDIINLKYIGWLVNLSELHLNLSGNNIEYIDCFKWFCRFTKLIVFNVDLSHNDIEHCEPLGSIRCSTNLTFVHVLLYGNVAGEGWIEISPLLDSVCSLNNVSDLSLQFNYWSGFTDMQHLRDYCDPSGDFFK